jgi:predicted nuclease with TOPRIM domain
MVLNNPFDRAKDPVNHDIFERFFSHIDIVKKRREFADSVHKEVLEKLEKNIKEMTPELLCSYNSVYQELTTMIKDFDKQIKSTEKKTKKLFESSTLTEDIYKMRDEMKVIKKKLDKLNSGLKNFSRLSDAMTEE